MLQQQLGNEPSVGAYEGEDGDAHVVAGARGMMRYRRNRASTIETPQGQQVNSQGSGILASNQNSIPSNGAGGVAANNAQWAMYQNSAMAGVAAGAKGNANNQMLQQVQQQQQQQQQLLRKSGAAPPVQTSQAAGGWNDRPKSAGLNSVNNTGAPSGNGAGGLIASLTGAGRPSSSTQAMSSSSNWSSGQGNVAGSSTANIAGGIGSSNTNTLSYGSLKNRFLSGSAAPKNAAGAGAAQPNTTSANAGAKSSSSKLFSLAGR